MTGAILNAVGILVGGLLGWSRQRPLSPKTEAFFKLGLGVFTTFYGLRLAWFSLNGSLGQILKQFGIALLAVTIGKPLGRLLRLQATSNHLGQYARKLIESTRPDHPHRFGNGLTACTILFCASPLGLLGAIHDGLAVSPGGWSYFYPLAVKAAMDGLAMLGFVRLFGLGALMSAVPVFVFLSLISMTGRVYLEPFLRAHELTDSVNAVGGMLLCVVALVIFEFKKVQLTDYLPALAIAPVLTWFWR